MLLDALLIYNLRASAKTRRGMQGITSGESIYANTQATGAYTAPTPAFTHPAGSEGPDASFDAEAQARLLGAGRAPAALPAAVDGARPALPRSWVVLKVTSQTRTIYPAC